MPDTLRREQSSQFIGPSDEYFCDRITVVFQHEHVTIASLSDIRKKNEIGDRALSPKPIHYGAIERP